MTRGHLFRDLLIGVGVGIFSGALGVGGGILLVPYLVLVLAISQKRAQATSLVMVAMAAGAGAVTYALAGSVAWLPAGFVIIGGLLGSLLGSYLVQRTADHRLQIAFGVLLIVVAIRLLFPTSTDVATSAELPTLSPVLAAAYILIGVAMGALSALFGIGGGILLIPVLVTGFGFAQQLAAGTSLAVMVPIALFGALRLTKPGLTDWRLGIRFGLGSIIGAVGGAALALAVPGEALRWIFAVVMLIVAARMVRVGMTSRT
jgi:uncharacterized membrane protein YfcA